ncbi:MAG: TonB-dependent receptor [Bacteroidota bacterium]
MLRSLLIALVLMACGTSPLLGQHALEGTVTDTTGTALKGAQVMVEGTALDAATDAKGFFRIDNLAAGTYRILVFSYGFDQHIAKVELPLASGSLSIQLRPLAFEMDEVEVDGGEKSAFSVMYLRPVEAMGIYAARKNEVIRMAEVNGNLATNNSRQIYAGVAGLNIWESDGAGLQLGIGGRGLSPNRTANFNTRQNGYDMSADALGYPESYYSPPSEAVERIQIVRGAASLQYGTQFGGMLNFILKEGPDDKPIEVISRQTVGSFGLFNSFNSIGGTKGKTSYYAYANYKRGDGWRDNAEFESVTAFAKVKRQVTKKLSLGLEHTTMYYLAQQPGGLTDVLFEEDARQSIRERNWFRVNWNLSAVTLDYRFSNRTQLNSRNFMLIAGRDAVGNLGRIDRTDQLTDRDLFIDDFTNFGNETRLLHRYTLFQRPAILLVGARVYHGTTHRRQGLGNAESGADFDYLNPDDLEGSDYDFTSQNQAVFVEHIFNLTNRLSITPGLRFEHIRTEADGYYKVRNTDLAGNILLDTNIDETLARDRTLLLAGIGVGYQLKPNVELYGNISQNYRAMNFNDIRTAVPSLEVDPDLQDEKGFSIDLGARGKIGELIYFDANLFFLAYFDRIGVVQLAVDDPILVRRLVRFRTNVSDSRNFGIESFAEMDLIRLFSGTKKRGAKLTVFSNLSLLNATYINSDETAIDGNEVELVPSLIVKTGISYQRKPFKISYQFGHTGEQFTDATNAERTADAVFGKIPSYYVMDLSASYTYRWLTVESGINNLTDNRYFTRRATGYPGPGIIPSDGRSFYLTAGVRF